MKRIKAVY